jgi:hypothetical protein
MIKDLLVAVLCGVVIGGFTLPVSGGPSGGFGRHAGRAFWCFQVFWCGRD